MTKQEAIAAVQEKIDELRKQGIDGDGDAFMQRLRLVIVRLAVESEKVGNIFDN